MQVIAQMGLWTAGFVLMTLVINAPLITPLMNRLGLNTASHAKQQVGREHGHTLMGIRMKIGVRWGGVFSAALYRYTSLKTQAYPTPIFSS